MILTRYKAIRIFVRVMFFASFLVPIFCLFVLRKSFFGFWQQLLMVIFALIDYGFESYEIAIMKRRRK